jgi:Ca-activated chloride channel family protein
MRDERKATYLFIVSLILCGCSGDSGISGKLLIMEGNFQNARGDYTGAISSYIQALEHTQAAPYSEFGLGSVYFTLGEEKAALERFAHAEKMLETSDPAANRELQYRIHYNTGVVLFNEGDFSGATTSFRRALTIDGGKKDAKRNLELSIRSLARENISGGGRNNGENESSENRAILFEYMRQKEFNQWKSREWQKEEEFNEPDY